MNVALHEPTPGRLELRLIEPSADPNELFEMWRLLVILNRWAAKNDATVRPTQNPVGENHIHLGIEGDELHIGFCGERILPELVSLIVASYHPPASRTRQ